MNTVLLQNFATFYFVDVEFPKGFSHLICCFSLQKWNILEAEIESDKIYGTDVSAKKEKLSTIIRKNTPEIKIEEKPNSKQVSPNKIPGKVIIREDSFF